MRRLSQLPVRTVRVHRRRAALSAAGVVLGVAAYVGVATAGAAVQDGFRTAARAAVGTADVQVGAVGAFGAPLPSATVDRLRRLPSVRVAVGNLAMRATLESSVAGHPMATVNGAPLVGFAGRDGARVDGVQVIRGRLPVVANEAVLTQKLLRMLRTSLGATVVAGASGRTAALHVVGVLPSTGVARLSGGVMAFTTLRTAQRLRGQPVVNDARVVLSAGTDVTHWIDRYRDAAGLGLAFNDASASGSGFASFLRGIGNGLTIVGMLAVFLGAYLIYLTLSIAVVERTQLYGTLRALGATARQVRRLVVGESLVLGVVGTAVGVAAGVGLSAGVVRALASVAHVPAPTLSVRLAPVLVGAALGLAATLAAGLVPATRAARHSPVAAMRGLPPGGHGRFRGWMAGLACMGVGLAVADGSDAALVQGTGMLLVQLGAVLCVPPLLSPVAALVGRVTRRLAPGVGDIAVMHLVKERGRSAYTLALVMVVLTFAFTSGAAHHSMAHSLDRVLTRELGADVQVRADGGFTPPQVRRAAATPGVAALTAVRYGHTTARFDRGQSNVGLRIVDPATYFQVAGFDWVHGSDTTARAALRRGGTVYVAQPLAARLGLHQGDTLTLATSRGPRAFHIGGVYAVFGGPPDDVAVGLPDAHRLFDAGNADDLEVNATPGTAPEELRTALAARLRDVPGFTASTAAAVKAEAERQMNGYFVIFNAVVAVALLVGLLGLANTLAVSAVQRRREVAVLRAVGVHRRAAAAMATVEAATLVAVAVVLAVPLGSLLSRIAVRGVSQTLGFSVDYSYPWAWLPALAVAAAALALIGARAPARYLSRLQVVDALRYD